MVHVRAFLINGKRNARGWRVNATTLAKNVLTFIKRPLILKRFADGRIDHREWDSSLSASQNLADQERNAIGHIDRVLYDKDTDSYFADIEIINQEAANWFRAYNNRKIPIAVSPQIIYDRRTQIAADIKDWFGSHLAIVGAGAYGLDAVATNICQADCPLDLPKHVNASDFGFHISAALGHAAAEFDNASLGASDGNFYNNMAMVEVTPSSPTNATTTTGEQQPLRNSPTANREAPFIKDVPVQNKAPVTVPEIQQQKPPNAEQNIDYKQLSEQLKSELEAAKVKIAEGQTLRDTLTEHEKKLAKYDADSRERSVREMIPVFLPEFLDKKGLINNEAVDTKVKDFLKRGFTPEDVKYMYAEKVAAFEDALNAGSTTTTTTTKGGCNCGGGESGKTAASASIYPVPEIQGSQPASAAIEKPWFVHAAKFFGKNNGQFSKRPGRVL